MGGSFIPDFSQLLVDQIDQGIMALDREFRVLLWNRWLFLKTGIQPGFAVSKGLKDILPMTPQHTIQRIQSVLETGIPMVCSPVLRQTGFFPIPVKHQYLKLFPLVEQGEVVGVLILIEDLSPRVTYEEEMRQMLKALLDASSDHIFLLRPDGVFMISNDRVDYLGFQKGLELVGRSIKDVFGEKWGGELAKALEVITLEGAHKRLELTTKREKKESIFEVNLYPVTKEGVFWAIGGNVRDITHQRQTEQMLRQAQKMEALGALAGGVAHDFNNILSIIIGYGELTLSKLREEDRLYGFVQNILKASQRAEQLVSQILTFSRKTEKKLRPVNPIPLIKEAIKMLRATIPAGIQIETRIPELPCKILSDPSHIHQILMNLCTNSVHSIGDVGRITISLDKLELSDGDIGQIRPYRPPSPGPYLRLSVEDTGCGISPEHMHKIFDPYFTTKPEGLGTGLGLAVVWGIVRQSNGGIGVNSEVGKGTTFEIYLPITESCEDEKKSFEDEEEIYKPGASILYVDDEPSILDYAKELLQKLGCRVTVCLHCQEALDVFKENAQDFDLVITDLSMPKMSGIELAKQLRKVRSDIRIVLSTGHGKENMGKAVEEYNFQGFLHKPFFKKDLVKVINQAMKKEVLVVP